MVHSLCSIQKQKELREECFTQRNYQSQQGTKLSFGGHAVLHRQPGCSCQPVDAKHCSVTEQNKIHHSQTAFRRLLTCTGMLASLILLCDLQNQCRYCRKYLLHLIGLETGFPASPSSLIAIQISFFFLPSIFFLL